MTFTRSPEKYLADQLERLMAMSLATPEDLAEWYRESDAVRQAMERRFPSFEFNHEVWHFLSDADIRFKDAEYRKHQHKLMGEYVRQLRDIKMGAQQSASANAGEGA